MPSCSCRGRSQSVPRPSLDVAGRDVDSAVAPCPSGNADIFARAANGSVSRGMDGAGGLYEKASELDGYVGYVLQRSCCVRRAPVAFNSVHELDESEL